MKKLPNFQGNEKNFDRLVQIPLTQYKRELIMPGYVVGFPPVRKEMQVKHLEHWLKGGGT